MLLEELGLIDQIDMCTLEALVGLGLFVVDGVNEALPVLLVDEVLIHAVVETRITRLLTELDVFHVGLSRQDAVIVLPGTQ